MAEEPNYKEAGETPPSTVDQQAPEVSESNAPSTDSPVATDIPSANTPDPKVASDINPNAAADKPTSQGEPGDVTPAQSAKAPAQKPADGEKAAKPAAKKEKGPAVEEKPFQQFMEQDYLPALKEALKKQGVDAIELSLAKQKIPVLGMEKEAECWQVVGSWEAGNRQFNLYFPEEDIQKQRAFSCAASGHKPSTLEPFLIDERKVTLDLMVFGVTQRLNAQKWLKRN